jgi:hypothetical protein
MSRPRGRDQAAALQRLFQILSQLAGGESHGVLRDTLETEVDLGAALPEDRLDILRRELRYLRGLGWQIRVEGEGELTRWFLEEKDPRLHTVLDGPELKQLARAAHKGGRDPRDLGLAGYVGGTLPFPVEIRNTDVFFLEELLHARDYRCLVEFTYAAKHRTLNVDDVRQMPTGVWLVVGREDGSTVQKQFRIDRIERPSTSGESGHDGGDGSDGQSGAPAQFEVGPPGSASARQPDRTTSDPLLIPDGSAVNAQVATTPDHEDRVTVDLGQATSRRESGGEVILTIPVTNRQLWRQRLYGLGTRVRLLGPSELRHEVRTELIGFLPGRRV